MPLVRKHNDIYYCGARSRRLDTCTDKFVGKRCAGGLMNNVSKLCKASAGVTDRHRHLGY